MKQLVLLVGSVGSGPEPPDAVKELVIFGCIAIVVLAFWYFIYYKE